MAAFEGKLFRGEGDEEYLQLLDFAARMFRPDPELQNVSMLYAPAWNGFVEGPSWDAWWIQNSYGPTYCALPFYVEPYSTFLRNAHELWFSQMGDGVRAGAHGWVAPDGCLCDCASPGWIMYKQGDGRIDIHDWGMEFTAAGLLMQAELLLIERQPDLVASYLPRLERCAAFIESRRDPKTNLFLAGPAGNLLAPSYAGWRKSDGSYGAAYLTGLSVTYIAALDRLVEVEKLAGRADHAERYSRQREAAADGLGAVTTTEGYFIRSLDPDGVKHGVYGAPRHGYFEASPNHDAICFRVADDVQSERIYEKIVSIPGLRPHTFILPNYPGYDDMYEEPTSWLWKFGTWVNGGHWSTCEARMVMAYCRLGRYEDARRSMRELMKLARQFRMDNPLVEFGSAVYQPSLPVNLCYDSLGAPAALIRGLFEYLYRPDGLTLIPHVPPTISYLEQCFPIRFGRKRLYLATAGRGPVTGVEVNGRPWKAFGKKTIHLPYDGIPDEARILVRLGGERSDAPPWRAPARADAAPPAAGHRFWDISAFVAASRGNTLPLRIGQDSEGRSGFVGDVLLVRLFGRALTEAEVARLAAGIHAKPEAGSEPAGQWEFGGGAGEGRAEVQHSPALMPLAGYTIDAWLCPKAFPERGMIVVSKLTASLDNGYSVGIGPGGTLRFVTEQGRVESEGKLEVGRWAHVAASLSSELRVYLDGGMVASAPAKRTLEPAALARFGVLQARLSEAGLAESYEARHAGLIVESVSVIHARQALLAAGKLEPLPEPSQRAADRSYVDALARLAEGLEATLTSYDASADEHRRRVLSMWKSCGPPAG